MTIGHTNTQHSSSHCAQISLQYHHPTLIVRAGRALRGGRTRTSWLGSLSGTLDSTKRGRSEIHATNLTRLTSPCRGCAKSQMGITTSWTRWVLASPTTRKSTTYTGTTSGSCTKVITILKTGYRSRCQNMFRPTKILSVVKAILFLKHGNVCGVPQAASVAPKRRYASTARTISSLWWVTSSLTVSPSVSKGSTGTQSTQMPKPLWPNSASKWRNPNSQLCLKKWCKLAWCALRSVLIATTILWLGSLCAPDVLLITTLTQVIALQTLNNT